MGYCASSESADFTICHERARDLAKKIRSENYIDAEKASSDDIDLILDALSYNGLTGEVGHDKNGSPYIESIYYEYGRYYDDDMKKFLLLRWFKRLYDCRVCRKWFVYRVYRGRRIVLGFIQEFYGHVVYEGMPVKDGKEKKG